jgi:hypothetical protein
MALPSQTRREQLKQGRQRRPVRLTRTVRLVLAALAGTAVVAIAARIVWPGAGGAGPAAEPAADAGNAAQDAGPAAPAPTPVERPAAAEAEPDPVPVQDVLAQADAVPAALPAAAEFAPMTAPETPSARRVQAAIALVEANRPVEARVALTRLLQEGPDPADEEFVRDSLAALNRRLVFSPEAVAGDPFSRVHMVGRGESLSTIVKSQKLQVDWRFILRVNGLTSERYLREGQRLKLVTGPFDAVVDKTDFRLDLYMGRGEERVYVTSLPVGLGEYDSTPVGRFRVRSASRTPNPAWANPRTGERFAADDPLNPIGEHWIGLEGIDDANRAMAGYGIHGTIDPDSIGRMKSMGCVRLLADDVALVYEVLLDGCPVEIRP